MDVFIYLAIGLIAFVIMTWHTRTIQPSFRSPPGPRPLPLVGNMFSLNFHRVHLTFAKLAELYGKIFKVPILGKDIIVINDITMLRKALQGEEFVDVFADRPDTFSTKYIMFDSDIAVGKASQSLHTLRKCYRKVSKCLAKVLLGLNIK